MNLLRSAIAVAGLAAACGKIAYAVPQDIFGHVQYANGLPVKHATVKFWSYGASSSLQPVTYSDDNGAFTLHLSRLDPGAVSASKESEGYPDAVLAYYGTAGYSSFAEISTSTSFPAGGLILKFGQRQETLVWHVADALGGRPIVGTLIQFEMVGNAEITGTRSPDQDGIVTFVLPRSPMKIRIVAPGYSPQNFVEFDHQPTDAAALFNRKDVRLTPLSLR